MKDSMEFVYQCPVCKETLKQFNKSFVCKKDHSFDISKEGYVNLLLANQKKTKDPGDSKFMAESRLNFLSGGFYDPLADEINKIIGSSIARAGARAGAGVEKQTMGAGEQAGAGAEASFNILDVGCGVGFYCGKLLKSLKDKGLGNQVKLWGLDISRSAIQKASKSNRDVNFCVGSGFHLPYRDASLDMIFSVFSPFDSNEIFRVLKPGGRILIVRPGANHLKELAMLIYGRSQLQGTPLDLSAELDFSLIKNSQINFEIQLKKNEDINNLVSMTPYYWHLNAENKAQLAEFKEFTATLDFNLSLYRKN